jgi:hypothetical protein
MSVSSVTVAGYTYKTDVVAGIHSEAIVIGVPGSSTEFVGATAASGLQVDVTRVNGTVAVSGPATDAQLRATPLPVSGTLAVTGPATDAQLRATPLSVSGPLTDAQLRAAAVEVKQTASPTATVTSVAGPATAQTLAAAKADRRYLCIENATGQILYVKLGAGASKSLRSFPLAPGRVWEMPGAAYGGIVTGILDAADSGSVMVTEY